MCGYEGIWGDDDSTNLTVGLISANSAMLANNVSSDVTSPMSLRADPVTLHFTIDSDQPQIIPPPPRLSGRDCLIQNLPDCPAV